MCLLSIFHFLKTGKFRTYLFYIKISLISPFYDSYFKNKLLRYIQTKSHYEINHRILRKLYSVIYDY